jgi:hypothetical protein
MAILLARSAYVHSASRDREGRIEVRARLPAIDIGPKLATVLKACEMEQLDERMAAGRDWEDDGLVFALLASGEPLKVVQERLGHHSPAFTQGT